LVAVSSDLHNPQSARARPGRTRANRKREPRRAEREHGLISVVIVNFNAGDYLRAAVDSVKAQAGNRCEIIVVDNDSHDHSLDRLDEVWEDSATLRVIALDENIGFARACNLGMQNARGRQILFMNPDCRLLPEALSHLLAALHSAESIGMVGARLINPDGSEQQGARRDVPNPWQIFCAVLQLHRLMPRHPRFRSFNLDREPLPDRPVTVQAVSGACMMVKRDAISAVGTMDSEYFLHFEDLDWCLRFNAAEWQILFVPEAVAEHTHGVCSAHAPMRVEYHKHRSLIRFLRKHFTTYYPSSFMALVAGLVTLRFAVLVPRLMWQRLFRSRAAVVGGAPEGARQS
jgi:hypothetical protein